MSDEVYARISSRREQERRRLRVLFVAFAGVALLLLAAVAFVVLEEEWLQDSRPYPAQADRPVRRAPRPLPQPVRQLEAPRTRVAEAPPVYDPGPDLVPAREAPEPAVPPSLSTSDSLVRRMARGLSANAHFASWLVTDDLIRRFTLSVDAVAGGDSPRDQVPFLSPEAPYSVARQSERVFVDPAAYSRFDVVASAFRSLDTEGCVRLYREVEPLIESAFRNLGFPFLSFRDRLASAIAVLLETPILEGVAELRPKDGVYAFSDAGLQTLLPAQKDLLRMGPENVRIVQAKLRELALALGISRQALPHTPLYVAGVGVLAAPGTRSWETRPLETAQLQTAQLQTAPTQTAPTDF